MTLPNSWIRCPKLNPQARLRLFCFPYAGGGASIYRLWTQHLPATVELCPIQLPGREHRIQAPPFDNLSALIENLGPRLLPYLDKPFAFFGHSMGSLISFELARYLRRQTNLTPSHLFVSSRRAPQLPARQSPLYLLPQAAFLDGLRHRYKALPPIFEQNEELLELFLPLLRADLKLVEDYTYTADEPLDCPISAFGGLDDDNVSREDLVAWREQTRNGAGLVELIRPSIEGASQKVPPSAVPKESRNEVSSQSFQLQMFPGGHFYWKKSPQALLHSLSQTLLSVSPLAF